LGPERLQIRATELLDVPTNSSFLESIRRDILLDSFAQDVLNHRAPDQASSSRSKNSRNDYRKFSLRDGSLFRSKHLYVLGGPAQLQVLQYCHDMPIAGHFGFHKTLELVTRNYWWPQLCSFVEHYVRTCHVCCRSKNPRHQPYGLLHPLPAPIGPWKSIALDFITDLPFSKGYDAILTVVVCFTKITHFLPCVKTFTSQDTSNMVTREVFKHHRLPDDIISDHGPQSISKF
jgi:hypothetical protein